MKLILLEPFCAVLPFLWRFPVSPSLICPPVQKHPVVVDGQPCGSDGSPAWNVLPSPAHSAYPDAPTHAGSVVRQVMILDWRSGGGQCRETWAVTGYVSCLDHESCASGPLYGDDWKAFARVDLLFEHSISTTSTLTSSLRLSRL